MPSSDISVLEAILIQPAFLEVVLSDMAPATHLCRRNSRIGLPKVRNRAEMNPISTYEGIH